MKNVTFIASLRDPEKQMTQKGKHIYKNRDKFSITSYNPTTLKDSQIQNNPSSKASKRLNENIKYSIFTSTPPSNILCISSQPISGKSINDTFKTKNDLHEFSQTILKETSLLEYDSIYNETTSQDKLYNEQIKDKITNLFHGKSSCVLLYGPHQSGKSYLLRGNTENAKLITSNNENCLILRAITDVFNLLSLSRQAENNFTVKMSSYQIFMDKVNDLLSKDKHKSPIKLEKYFDKHQRKCNLIGLSKVNIRNKSDFDTCLKEIMHQRRNIAGIINIDNLKSKSHFAISITLEKRNYIDDYDYEIELYSQIDFVELASSDYGFMGENDEDKSQESIIYKHIAKSFNSLSDAIVSACSSLTMKNETTLSLCLKHTINWESNIVFINCIIPYEYPISESYKAIKFTNWLRNQVINLEGNRANNTTYANENQEQYNEVNIPSENNCDYNNNLIQSYNEKNINNQVVGVVNNKRNDVINKTDCQINNKTKQNIIHNNGLNNSVNNIGLDELQQRMKYRSQQQQNQFNTLDSENKNISSIAMNPNDNYNYSKFIANQYNKPNINNDNNNNQYKLTQSNDYSFDPSIIANNPKHARQFQNISQSLNQMNDKSLALANANVPNAYIVNEQPQVINDSTTSPEIEQMKSEYAAMKSDNIMLKEDIARLTTIKEQLENELQFQQNRNIELTSLNEQLQSQLKLIESKNNDINIKLQNGTLVEINPNKTSSDNLYEMLNSRLSFETKLRDMSNELNYLRQSKQQLEIDYRVLQERYDNLHKNYNQIINENNCIKCNYNSQINNIENRISASMKEIERLQNENTHLRINEESLIKSNNDKEHEKEKYRNMYEKERNNTNLMQIQLNDIERGFNKLLQEKENEHYLKKKEDEYKQRKNESKLRFVNDLQSKLTEFKNERLRKKQQEDYY